MKFFNELKRRNVIKATVAYITVAWVLLQLISVVLPNFGAPEWVLKTFTFILIVGLPVWIIFSWVYELTPEGLKKTKKVAQEESITEQTNKRLNIIIIITLLVLAAVTYFKEPDTTQASSIEEISNRANEKSIAVLPFKNDSSNKDNIYFCDGIMEGVRENLSKIPGLSVVSRTSVEQYRENPPSVTEIANQLKVNYILEGSVLRIENRSIISARLIYAPEDHNVWSDQYDKEMEDVFSVLAEVTTSIAEKLKATISPEVLKNIENEPTTDLTAYDYYLQGKEYFNNYELSGHKDDFNNADRLFQIALDLDSTFALAFVGRARILKDRHQYEFYYNEYLVDSMLQMCNKAISLDPAAADAYWIRGGFYDDFLFEISKAEEDLKMALNLNPNHVGAIRQMSWLTRLHHRDIITALQLLKTLEKLDRSVKELQLTYGMFALCYRQINDREKELYYLDKAIELGPGWIYDKAWYYAIEGRIPESIDLIEQSEEDYQIKLGQLGFYYLLLKDYNRSLEYFEEWAALVKKEGAHDSSGVKDWHRYGEVLVETGRIDEGIKIMTDQLEQNEKLLVNFQVGYEIFYENAGIYAFLGNKKEAFKYLRKFDQSNRWEKKIDLIQIDPLFDNIRDEEEFKAIINRQLESTRKISEEVKRMEALGEL